MLSDPAFRRTFLAAAALTAIATAAVAVALCWLQESGHDARVRTEMGREALMASVHCSTRYGQGNIAQLSADLRPLARTLDARIDVFDPSNGGVLVSADAGSSVSEFKSPPAGADFRGPDGSGQEVVSASFGPVPAGRGQVIVVRVTRLADVVDAPLRDAQLRIAWAAAAVWLAALALFLFAFSSIHARAASLRLALNEPKAILPPDLDGVLGDIARRSGALLEESRLVQRDRSTIRTEADAILGGMAEGVIAVDREGRLRIVNAAAEIMLGLNSGAVVGQPIGGVVRFEGMAEAAAKASGGAERTFRVEIPGPPQRVLEVHAEPVAQAGGAVLVLRDVSEEAKYADMRRDFVAAASHELRTPIAVIRAAAETLQDGALNQPEQAKQFLDSIHRHALSMEALIKDLLDLGKLESRPDLTLRPIDVAEVLHRSAALHEPEAKKRRHEVEFTSADALPRLIADASLLERAFSNILENAIRYTPDGGKILIRATAEGGRVRVEIEDTGAGIPEKELKRIFERFYRVDRSRSREQGGTGLGLAIVKHVVQLHKGEVWAESGAGRGAKFVVVLPGI
ncbi:MAG: two-component system OmpR family phosphate regulon sensor histidine kinase [Planctomycetota bacterium]|nr:MAG: two-component system OmpR family phosphate regulon sensor histidine kinase [Planctomycetota bacterium]